MKRVVLLVTDLERGGTPLRLRDQALLLRNDYDIHVGCLAPLGPVGEDLSAHGIATFACDARGVRDLGALQRLQLHLEARQPDLLHTSLTHANVAGRFIAGRLALPTIGSTATIERERWLHRLLERWTIDRDAAHAVGSQAVRDHVHESFGYPLERIHLIPPTLPPGEPSSHATQLDLPNDSFVVGWFGRFDPVKRLEWLLAVARALPPQDRVLLVGDGSERTALQQQIERNGLTDRFVFAGWQDDPTPWRTACDVIVSPSLTEGMPNAVLQALRDRIPVVASNIPAHRELAEHSGAVLLAETPNELVQQVLALRADRERLAALGARGAKWIAQTCSPEQCRAALCHLYESVLDDPRTNPEATRHG